MSFLKLIFHLFYLSLLNFAIIEADGPQYLKHTCSSNKTFTPSSPYQSNLNTLLTSLFSHATGTTQFYNTTAGGGNAGDTIYGAFMCRGDVTNQMCQDCMAIATQQIASWCPYSKEAIIWYHECLVRYSNRSFFSTVDEWPRLVYVDYNMTTNLTKEGSYGWVLANTLNDAVAEAANAGPAGTKKFATKRANLSASESVYTLVQCTPDLSSQDCSRCLGDMMGDIPLCCLGREGGMVLYPSCSLMFGLKQFYRDFVAEGTRTPPTPLPTVVGTGESRNRRRRSRTIILIVVPAVVSAMLFSLGCYLLRRKARKSDKTILKENFGDESATLEPMQFDLAIIEAATNNFSHENMIGKGGFGQVYKGILPDGRHIAVKKLSRSSGQGATEFKNEVLLIAKLQHRNLVAFIGFCLEVQEKILIYEYVRNRSLDFFLFDTQQQKLLNWSQCYKIIGGIARGILYLHEYSSLKVIHRDLKPSNILLDENINPKISDFDMARIVEIDQNQGSTNRIVGTYFGVMVFEIITGKRNVSFYDSHRVADGLLSYVWRQWSDQTPLSILDPNVKENYSQIEVMSCIQIGLLCVQENPNARPTMATVVSYLISHSIELPSPQEPAFFLHGRIDPNRVAQESRSGQSVNSSTPFSINEMSISKFFPR